MMIPVCHPSQAGGGRRFLVRLGRRLFWSAAACSTLSGTNTSCLTLSRPAIVCLILSRPLGQPLSLQPCPGRQPRHLFNFIWGPAVASSNMSEPAAASPTLSGLVYLYLLNLVRVGHCLLMRSVPIYFEPILGHAAGFPVS